MSKPRKIFVLIVCLLTSIVSPACKTGLDTLNRLKIVSEPTTSQATNTLKVSKRGLGGIRVVTNKDHLDGSKDVHLYDRMTAVIIGIDHYQNLERKDWLENAVKDAKGVEEVLRKQYPFDQIITLYNEEATKEGIIKVLQGDLARTGPEDGVLIYFAGHGVTRSMAKIDLGYLIPYDGSLKHDQTYKNISMQQMRSDISPLIPAKHVFFIADACFGGLLLETRSTRIETRHDLAYLKEITGEHVRQVLTAGGKGEEVLDGGPRGHSVFTGRLIEALEQVDDYITGREIGKMVEKQVYGDARARGHKQRPLVGELYGTGDFVFVPDQSKRDDEIRRLEEELANLAESEKKMEEMGETSKLWEMEQQRLLKEAALKQARIRKDEARIQAEIKADEEAALEKNNQDQKIYLASLHKRANRLREKLGTSAKVLGLEDAAKKIRRINKMLVRIETDFDKTQDTQIRSVQEHYASRIARAKNIEPWDRMFETKNDYRERVQTTEKQVASLQTERDQRLKTIRQQVSSELASQRKPFEEQKNKLTKQTFQLGPSEVSFKLEKYVLEKKYFVLSMEVGSKEKWGATFSDILYVPKDKARNFYDNPDLLVPILTLGLDEQGKTTLRQTIFHGPEGKKYDNEWLIDNGDGTLTDMRTGLIGLKNANCFGRKQWDDAMSAAANLASGSCGLSDGSSAGDWRLPTEDELPILIEWEKNGAFSDVRSSYYWSSTSYASSTDRAWYVSLSYGRVNSLSKAGSTYVWPVRGGH